MYVSMYQTKVQRRVVPGVGLYVFGFRSDVGRCPRNVCILDVFVIIACACIVCFRITVRCQAMPEECLYASGFRFDVRQGPRNVYMFMLCDLFYLLICLYVYWALHRQWLRFFEIFDFYQWKFNGCVNLSSKSVHCTFWFLGMGTLNCWLWNYFL